MAEMDLREYLIQLAPDFSVFDMFEQIVYKQDLTPDSGKDLLLHKGLFEYGLIPTGKRISSNLYRGMVKVIGPKVEFTDTENVIVLNYTTYQIFLFWDDKPFELKVKGNTYWTGVGF